MVFNLLTVQCALRFTLSRRIVTYCGIINLSFSLYCQEWEVNLHFFGIQYFSFSRASPVCEGREVLNGGVHTFTQPEGRKGYFF